MHCEETEAGLLLLGQHGSETHRAGGGEAGLPRPLSLTPIPAAGWSGEGPRSLGWSWPCISKGPGALDPGLD